MEVNQKDKDSEIKPIKKIESEKEIFSLCKIDNNSKIVIGMSNDTIAIYSSDLSSKIVEINNQPSFYISELPDKTNRGGIKLLCCSYSYQFKILELIFNFKNKFAYNILYTIEPNESRNEINKAIELKNEDKNIVSIDENNIIVYKLLGGVNYTEIKKISEEGATDILNINNNLFCVSFKNKGTIQFYDNKTFNLIKQVKNIESYGCNNYICKLNNDILFIGGFEYISLIDIELKQLNNKIELIKNKERITCTCPVIEKGILIAGTKYKFRKENDDEFLFDIIIYKLNIDMILTEIKRFPKAHDKIINSIVEINGYIISCSDDKKIKQWYINDLIN